MEGVIIFLLIYLDDIIVASSSHEAAEPQLYGLKSIFSLKPRKKKNSLKDIGGLRYFLYGQLIGCTVLLLNLFEIYGCILKYTMFKSAAALVCCSFLDFHTVGTYTPVAFRYTSFSAH